jgi:hypothetical protein
MNTSMGKLGEKSVQSQAGPVNEPVWVQCNGFRCLAYLNQKGEWRAYSSGAKLSNVVKVLDKPLEKSDQV